MDVDMSSLGHLGQLSSCLYELIGERAPPNIGHLDLVNRI
jgi:hypothetical protein